MIKLAALFLSLLGIAMADQGSMGGSDGYSDARNQDGSMGDPARGPDGDNQDPMVKKKKQKEEAMPMKNDPMMPDGDMSMKDPMMYDGDMSKEPDPKEEAAGESMKDPMEMPMSSEEKAMSMDNPMRSAGDMSPPRAN